MTIDTLQAPTFPALSGLARVARNASAFVVDLFHAYKSRRALAELAHLDDHMLRDIGLTRGDVRDAVAEPLWRDPTHILASRVRERRVTRSPVSTLPVGLVAAPPLAPFEDEGAKLFPARSRFY